MYCSQRCRDRAEKYRWSQRYPGRAAEKSTRWRTNNREAHRKWHREDQQRRTYGYVIGDNPLAHTKDRFRHARALGYRSGLEVAIANQLEAAHVPFEYETLTIPFIPKPKVRRYKPDILLTNGIILELKGRFVTADRQKHIAVKENHPDLDIRLVLSNAHARISKQSKTTYSVWCDSQGIPWAHRTVPASWLSEPPNRKSLAAIAALLKEKK